MSYSMADTEPPLSDNNPTKPCPLSAPPWAGPAIHQTKPVPADTDWEIIAISLTASY